MKNCADQGGCYPRPQVLSVNGSIICSLLRNFVYSFVSKCYFKTLEKRGNVGLLSTTPSHCTLTADIVQWLSQSHYSISIIILMLQRGGSLEKFYKLGRVKPVLYATGKGHNFWGEEKNNYSMSVS